MCKQAPTYHSSIGQDPSTAGLDGSIGDLFRDYGEAFIRTYKPPLHKIKLIRSIRVCRSPALGGKMLICKSCGHRKVIYLSCGNSQCPLCQNHKRNIWQAKVSQKMLNVPYVHTVFTVPHQFNRLALLNERAIYNITMRAAWACVKTVAAKSENVGGLPAMITVLHTFGSDMKHHIHVHALISFGGLKKDGTWVWPKRKNKIAPFREISRVYRDTFLKMLRKHIKEGLIIPVDNLDDIIEELKDKRWNVSNGRPTMDTHIIERYLARYINRTAISKSRLKYLKHQDKLKSKVEVVYNDYRNKKTNQAAPKATDYINPLIAINKFMMHVLPPYFQKSRHYGLHAWATWKKYKPVIPQELVRHPDTVRHLFTLLKALIKQDPVTCERCEKSSFEIKPVSADVNWIFKYVTLPVLRGPPKINRSYQPIDFKL